MAFPGTRRALLGASRLINPATVPWRFLHLDGSAITGYAPLDSLTTWTDLSGNGRDAATTGIGVVPKYIYTGTLPSGGDKGMVWYNPFEVGGSQNGGLFPESALDQGTGWTFYLWFRAFDVSTTQVLWQNEAGGAPQLRWVSSGKFGWRDAGGIQEIGTATTGYHSLIYSFAGATGAGVGEVFYDGLSAGTAASNWSAAGVTNYIMGDNIGSGASWNGWMAEFIGYAGVHSPPTRQGIRSFLRSKWGWG